MSVYIECGGQTYRDIKSVSFAPEYDPTLSTLPVCQFEVEIVTDDAPEEFMGATAHLHEDLGYENATNTLLAGWYDVVEAERIGPKVVRVLAKSLLAWLEKRKLAAKQYSVYSSETFLRDLFTEQPVEDGPIWGSNPPIGWSGTSTITGYCPEQTARERLQWYCQAYGKKVVQWGAQSAVGLYVCNPVDETKHMETCVNSDQTYNKPVVKHRNTPNALIILGYSGFTTTRHEGDGWDSAITGYEYELAENGVIPVEQRIYFEVSEYRYDNPNYTSDAPVTYAGNYIMLPSNAAQGGIPSREIRTAVFMPYEVEANVLQIKPDGTNDDYIWPGEAVSFCVKSGVFYKGIVKSCDFTFGKLAKSRMVLYSDLTPLELGYLSINYRAYINGTWRTFMTNHFVAAKNTKAYYTAPDVITAWVDGEIMTFERRDNNKPYRWGYATPDGRESNEYYDRVL